MLKLLIVDDSALTRDYHSQILASAGFECTTALDGINGLEKAINAHFDVILTDINMQGMDGYEFIRRVRQCPHCSQIPIVIISTEAKNQDKQKGFAAGANFYLTKPVNEERMIESIKLLTKAA